MKNEYEIREVRVRFKRGETKKAIARRMHIARATVKRYINMSADEAAVAMEGGNNRSSSLDVHKDLIEQIFWEANGNCVCVHEVLESKGIYCKLITLQWYCREKLGLRRALRLKKTSAAKHPERIETGPGEEIQIDFGEKDVTIGGRTVRVHFFVGVLGYSRRLFVKFFACENQETWLSGLEGAFMHFQGIPHKVICDNARALIRDAKRFGEAPIYTKAFSAFCRYWGIRPIACHPYTPQEKGKVERCVRYVKENFLSGIRKFTSLQDVQEQFEEWESQHASKRIIRGLDGIPFSPEQRFAEEKEALRPVLKASIADYRVEERKVSASNCVSAANRLFKLPEDLRNLTVDVLIGREMIIVSHEGRTIARLDKQANAYRPMIRPEERVSQERLVRVSLPGSPFDRSISNYEEAALCC